MFSFTRQIYSSIINYIPSYTDEFSKKYLIKSMSFDYTTLTATGILSESDLITLQSTNNKIFIDY